MKKKPSSSSSGSLKHKAREFLPLVAGLFLTGLALFIAGRRIAAMEKKIHQNAAPIEIVVASVPIKQGEPFSEENLAKKSIPSSGTGRRNIPASEFELLLGAKSKGPVEPGEPVLWTDVEEPVEVDRFSFTIPDGQRAVTLVVDATSSFSGMIRPGDRVDLLCEKGSGSLSKSWIRNIPVLSVDRHFSGIRATDDSQEPSTVTLLVTPQQGTALSELAGNGRLHWFLRNPGDNAAVNGTPSRKVESTPSVEMWKGGHRVFPEIGIKGEAG